MATRRNRKYRKGGTKRKQSVGDSPSKKHKKMHEYHADVESSPEESSSSEPSSPMEQGTPMLVVKRAPTTTKILTSRMSARSQRSAASTNTSSSRKRRRIAEGSQSSIESTEDIARVEVPSMIPGEISGKFAKEAEEKFGKQMDNEIITVVNFVMPPGEEASDYDSSPSDIMIRMESSRHAAAAMEAISAMQASSLVTRSNLLKQTLDSVTKINEDIQDAENERDPLTRAKKVKDLEFRKEQQYKSLESQQRELMKDLPEFYALVKRERRPELVNSLMDTYANVDVTLEEYEKVMKENKQFASKYASEFEKMKTQFKTQLKLLSRLESVDFNQFFNTMYATPEGGRHLPTYITHTSKVGFIEVKPVRDFKEYVDKLMWEITEFCLSRFDIEPKRRVHKKLTEIKSNKTADLLLHKLFLLEYYYSVLTDEHTVAQEVCARWEVVLENLASKPDVTKLLNTMIDVLNKQEKSKSDRADAASLSSEGSANKGKSRAYVGVSKPELYYGPDFHSAITDSAFPSGGINVLNEILGRISRDTTDTRSSISGKWVPIDLNGVDFMIYVNPSTEKEKRQALAGFLESYLGERGQISATESAKLAVIRQ